MRALIPSVFAAAFFVAGVDATATGGVYASSPSQDAAACARACADDGLCMAWSFQADGACELRATVPASQTGVAQGLSRRAPALRVGGPIEAAAIEPVVAMTPITAPAETAAPPIIEVAADDEPSTQLLGGLDEDSAGLRP